MIARNCGLLGVWIIFTVMVSIGRGADPPANAPDKPADNHPDKTTAKPKRIVQATDGSVTLSARDVTAHGTTVRYEPEKTTIGYWTKLADYVSWDLLITQPGRFDVDLYQACGQGSGGSEYAVEIGDQKLADKVQDTGSFRNFRLRHVGTIELTKPGNYTLTVRPLTKPDLAVMDLRYVTLKLPPPEKKDTAAPPAPLGSDKPSGGK